MAEHRMRKTNATEPGWKKLARRTDRMTKWRTDAMTAAQNNKRSLHSFKPSWHWEMWHCGCSELLFFSSPRDSFFSTQQQHHHYGPEKAAAVPGARILGPGARRQELLVPVRLSWNVANQRCSLPHLYKVLGSLVNDDEDDRWGADVNVCRVNGFGVEIFVFGLLSALNRGTFFNLKYF